MSTPGYAPYHPQLEPRRWAENIWKVEGPEVRYSLLGLSVPCPTRMTVIRLPGDRLWLHSPVVWSEELDLALRRLGVVSAIVAPNSLHHVHVQSWATAHPRAVVYASPDLPSRLAGGRGWQPLANQPPSDWQGAISQHVVDLGSFVEVIFFHEPTRTLIVTDLMQNFEDERVTSPIARTLLRLGGATGPVGTPSIEIRLAGLRRQNALHDAVAQMLAWDPLSIMLSHGRCYGDDAREELAKAFPRHFAGCRPAIERSAAHGEGDK